jgi:hypothetical protein
VLTVILLLKFIRIEGKLVKALRAPGMLSSKPNQLFTGCFIDASAFGMGVALS